MPDQDAVLFANEAFYRAFADGDLPAMEDVWADRDDIVCLHPGWGPIFGRTPVMESWQAILGAGGEAAIRCLDPRAMVYGDMAIVVCFEALGGGRLVATNMFARDGSLWRMILHQAGPTQGGPRPAEAPPQGPMH